MSSGIADLREDGPPLSIPAYLFARRFTRILSGEASGQQTGLPKRRLSDLRLRYLGVQQAQVPDNLE